MVKEEIRTPEIRTPEIRTPKSARDPKSAPARAVDIWAVQCGNCLKWRKVASQEEFEEIRSNFKDDPFYCNRNPKVSCDDPADIEYDSTRTWAVDKPNLPKPPAGFSRRLMVRKDFSRIDVYYQAPTGRTLRCPSEVNSYLAKNPQLKDVTLEQFSFTRPKVMDDTIPSDMKGKGASGVID